MSIIYNREDDIYYADTAAEVLAASMANYPRFSKFYALDTKAVYISNGSTSLAM